MVQGHGGAAVRLFGRRDKTTTLGRVARRAGDGVGVDATYVRVNGKDVEARFLLAENVLSTWMCPKLGDPHTTPWLSHSFATRTEAMANLETRLASLKGDKVVVDVEMTQTDLEQVAAGQPPTVRYLGVQTVYRWETER